MADISSLTSSLFVARPSRSAASLTAAARAHQAAGGTAAARTQQLKASQAVAAQQLAVTKGLANLSDALDGAQFETSAVAGDREEIRETRIRYGTRDVYRDEAVTQRRDTFARRDITALRDVLETRDVFAARDLFETRSIYETRNITETRDVYGDQPVYETQGIYEDRPVYETRNVTETRPVYTQQEIRDTIVNGTRTLTSFNRISNAGIDVGADFSVKVGTDATATIAFSATNRLTLTVSGHTTTFSFQNNNGSWRGALVDALNSITNLDAAIGTDGKLRLQTEHDESIAIADVANGFLDFSASPLSALGLTAGTTNSTVTGYQQVQTGTETVVTGTQQVQVGTEHVQTGSQQVQVGTTRVVVGSETVVTGTEDIVVGTEEVLIGSEQVKVGTEDVVVGQESFITGSESFVSGTQTSVTGTRRVLDRTDTVQTGTESVLVGFHAADTENAPAALTRESRRAILEAVLSLENAIGRQSGDNPFVSLRGALGLSTLATFSTPDQRDATLAKVKSALDGLSKSTAEQSPVSTLVQAGLGALGQGAKSAYASGFTTNSTFKLLA